MDTKIEAFFRSRQPYIISTHGDERVSFFIVAKIVGFRVCIVIIYGIFLHLFKMAYIC